MPSYALTRTASNPAQFLDAGARPAGVPQRPHIYQEPVSRGLIYGKFVYSRMQVRGSILLVHGISVNRNALQPLAQYLAELGFGCLIIDLPQHYENDNKFTLGILAQTVTEGCALVRQRFGTTTVSVVSHSLGTLGALMALLGYSTQVEQVIGAKWNQLLQMMSVLEDDLQHGRKNGKMLYEKFDGLLKDLREAVASAAITAARTGASIDRCILLSSPRQPAKALRGIGVLNKLPFKPKKILLEFFLDKPMTFFTKVVQADPSAAGLGVGHKEDEVYWGYFHTPQVTEFINYVLEMTTPMDYLGLVKWLATCKSDAHHQNLFSYIYARAQRIPKLFVYPSADLLGKMFFWERKATEQYYASWGSAQIKYMNLTHNLREGWDLFGTTVVDNEQLDYAIAEFLTGQSISSELGSIHAVKKPGSW